MEEAGSVHKLTRNNSTNIPQHGSHDRWTVLLFPCWSGEPLIKISSTSSSNKLPIGATINLTCTAWQTDELAMNYIRTRPHRIEWFDPQGKRVGNDCRAGWPPAKLMKCTLDVGALTEEKLGNYTCRARNRYNYCSTKRFEIGFEKGKKKKPEWPVVNRNALCKLSWRNFNPYH